MICPNCKNENPEDARFCGSCGSEIIKDCQEKKGISVFFLGKMLDLNYPPNFFPPYDLEKWNRKINTPNTYERGYQDVYYFSIFYDKKSNISIPKQNLFGSTTNIPLKNIVDLEKYHLKHYPGYSMLVRKQVVLKYIDRKKEYKDTYFKGVLVQFIANNFFRNIAYYEINDHICTVYISVPMAEKNNFYQKIEEYFATLEIDDMGDFI